ncbi:NAD(P)-dependent alcohol dehydrogenase [Hymenobacter sp. 15J16-1T3B]|uniref:NAD(P)-dependent alcohol dehydrogenase n=1 Tax=Hymenobacter sp. 15J16-1T3B TaxID=2886941 RepID=UPI001D102970|nr:NAD(P)-dependent alcohol dehydrogenase [Hymenobacter sp. 15J16-1T3B]MCC3158034.1 NAD(P)-dependent alcohol dehydrogenase [Hymenobacter sp. 15J16-1T3B]
MSQTQAYAATAPTAPLAPFQLERREVGSHDVQIQIMYCGVCHSDVHQARDEWGGSTFPMVPGHEIVGRVTQVGAEVSKFRTGDLVGVGCMVDTCRTCPNCQDGLEQYCETHISFTYNSTLQDRQTRTYGGYSQQIVVDENYVLRVSDRLPLEGVAPLLCAGITTYSPLKHWGAGPGKRVGVVGLGGLGHMAVKLGAAMGAEVTVLSTSPAKEADARALGAHRFVVTKDAAAMKQERNYFDLIINTVGSNIDLNPYLGLLRLDGTMVMVGLPPTPPQVGIFPLVGQRRRLAGSHIGGIAETQEMLDFCAEHGIVSDVEVIPMNYVNVAYERMLRSDVKYRFVIDLATL